MAVSSVGTGSSTATSKVDSATKQLGTDLNNFLKLLTTQLQNQDPTSPLDTNQFTQQLIGFSQVEQAVQTNENLSALLELQQGSARDRAMNFLGRQVDYDGNRLELGSNGKATMAYTIDEGAVQAQVIIKDNAGKVLYQQTVPAQAGPYRFNWDGKTLDGITAAPGLYSVTVQAADKEGKAVTTATRSRGTVTDILFVGEEPTLVVNGEEVPLSELISVSAGA